MTKSFLDPPRNQEPLMSSGNWQPWLPWAGDAGDRFCSFLLLLGSLDPPSSARQSSRQRVTSLMIVITTLPTSQPLKPWVKSNHLVITFLMFSSFHKLTYAFNTSELIRSKHLLDAAEASSDHERRGDCPWLVYYIIGHWTSPQPHNFCVFYARKASLYNGLLICKPNTVVKLQVTTIIIYWQVSSTPQLFTGSTGSMRLGACECSPFIAATRAVTRALAANQRTGWPGPDQSEARAGHGQASEPSPGGPGQWPLTRLEAAEDLSHRQERGNLGHHGYTGCCFNICDYNNKLTKH